MIPTLHEKHILPPKTDPKNHSYAPNAALHGFWAVSWRCFALHLRNMRPREFAYFLEKLGKCDLSPSLKSHVRYSSRLCITCMQVSIALVPTNQIRGSMMTAQRHRFQMFSNFSCPHMHLCTPTPHFWIDFARLHASIIPARRNARSD